MKSCEHNPYVEMMYKDFAPWAFDEKATQYRGLWRSDIFSVEPHAPLDLEIGTGNGFHFANYTKSHSDRCVVGLELKYKPLVQSIRRSLNAGAENSRMVRFAAEGIDELFGDEELDNVFIHFPDPWPKKRHHKNRLIQPKFLEKLYATMKKGGVVEFKTDHYGYFLWAVYHFRSSPFTIQFFTEDLHNSLRKDKNFITHFESLFLKKGQPIFCCILKK